MSLHKCPLLTAWSNKEENCMGPWCAWAVKVKGEYVEALGHEISDLKCAIQIMAEAMLKDNERIE